MKELTINRLGHLGDGIAELDGDQVFAPFTLPGEVVSGEVQDGRIESPRILSPVADRIKPACRHFKRCGGCAMQHTTDAVIADWKQESLRLTLAQAGLEAELRAVITSPPASRRRAGFTVRRTKSGVMLGFMGRASDQLVELSECPLIVPQITEKLDALSRLGRYGVTRKEVAKLAVTQGENGLDIAVTSPRDLTPQEGMEIGALAEAEGFARIAWNGEVVALVAEPIQKFDDIAVTSPPDSFLQATKPGEAALIGLVNEMTDGATRVLDLFAGCGTFSLPLAKNAEVHAVEGSAEMLDALTQGWRKAHGLQKVTTEARDLFRRQLLPDEINRYDIAVLDPPRAGAAAQVAELAASNLSRIAYVSCNPASFARDAAGLTRAGFQLDWVQLVDQFRWAHHCELVGQFSR